MISVSHSGVEGDSSILGYVTVSPGSKVADVMCNRSRLTGLQCLIELLELSVSRISWHMGQSPSG